MRIFQQAARPKNRVLRWQCRTADSVPPYLRRQCERRLQLPFVTMTKWQTDLIATAHDGSVLSRPVGPEQQTNDHPNLSRCYDDSAAIRPQNTMPSRPNALQPCDAKSNSLTFIPSLSTNRDIATRMQSGRLAVASLKLRRRVNVPP